MIGRVGRAAVRVAALLALATAHASAADPGLFESRRITPVGEYTAGIEGPAVDDAGALYVVNFGKQGTIGRLPPGADHSALFATLPAGSIGNGIRFDRAGRMYVADYKRHNVLVLEPGGTRAAVYVHDARFNQPNDLAIAPDGTLYASDPSFKHHSGRIWRIERGADGRGRGAVMSSPRAMGTTNGLDVSPDGRSLYVSESQSREVWAYAIQGSALATPRLVRRFDAGDLDGLRLDVDGRLYVTRPGVGAVAVLAPDGTLVRDVRLQGSDPTNLTFGGPDGRTVFVTQAGGGRFVESFRVDRPGREPCLRIGSTCGEP